MFPETQL